MPAWETRRVVRPIVVQDETPSLVGSVWVRRDKQGDAWDEIRLTGLFCLGPDLGVEACVTPTSFGPVMTTSAEGLVEAYTLKEHAEEADRLADLLAGAAAL